MTLELERELPDLLNELAAAHRVGDPPTVGTATMHLARAGIPRRRVWPAAVAATTAAIVVGGLVVLVNRGGEPSPVDAPAPAAVILAPDAGSGFRLRERYQFGRSGEIYGAVASADGTIYRLFVASGRGHWPPDGDSWQRIADDRKDVAMVGRYDVAALYNSSETDDQTVSWFVRHPCNTVSLWSWSPEMWPTDVAAVLDGLTIADRAAAGEPDVRIALPPGWSSMGSADVDSTWMTSGTVFYQGSEEWVFLTQAPGAPVGYLLGSVGVDSDPTPLGGAEPGWWVATGQANTLFGPYAGGSVAISSGLPVDALRDLIGTLVPVDTARIDALVEASTGSAPPSIGSLDSAYPPEAGCSDLGAGLEIVER